MNFATKWKYWIKAYLVSLNYTFLINGHPIGWVNSTRGIRQEALISPFLFLIVSKILFALLNQALKMNMVSSLGRRLSTNFNHLMFTDNLTIITQASWGGTRFSKVCLDFYIY